MHEDIESSLSYTPTLKDLQSVGYADWYAESNEHYTSYQFVFVAPTCEEMEAAYRSAMRLDDGSELRIMRGFTFQVDFSSSTIRHKATAFRPDPNGDEEVNVEGVYEYGRIIEF